MSGLLLGRALALVLLPSNISAAAVPLLEADWNASSVALGWVAVFGIAGAASILCALPLLADMRRGQPSG